ncbi:MAG TPA: ThuA domain-containing protein [Polyangia bacterium]
MISSTARDHLASSAQARMVLPALGMQHDFIIDATTDNTLINDANLAKYDVFLQMHLAPFEIKVEQRAALENFVKSGKGWVGVHAAGLIIPSQIGPGRALPDWPFYNDLIGHVTYVTHPLLQTGVAIMEDRTHPATRNMPPTFTVRDEWYEFSGNPRANVRVLGGADERSYNQVKKMGDHPLIWTCEKYKRAIYIGIGHDPSDFQNPSWMILLRDSLLWAAGRLDAPADGGVDGATDGPTDAPIETGSEAGGRGGASADAAVDMSTMGAGGLGMGGASTGMGGTSGGASGAGGTSTNGGSSGAGGVAGAGGRPSNSTGNSGGGCTLASGPSASSWLVLPVIGWALLARRRRRTGQWLRRSRSQTRGVRRCT